MHTIHDIKICWLNVQCSDLHNQIQVINNRALPIILQQSIAVQQMSCTSSYSTEVKTDGYHWGEPE